MKPKHVVEVWTYLFVCECVCVYKEVNLLLF
jgi:hypothetical protein